MPRIDETAYRQLKASPTERELRELYTPTLDERHLARQHTTGKPALVAFLVLLKTFQHLGYAVALSAVPMPIVLHIAKQLECQVSGQDLITYDLSGTRRRHLQVIRSHLQIVAEGTAMREAMEQAMREACESKDDVIDLINIAIEQLIRQRFELPAFSTLERTAKRIRAEDTSGLHARIATTLTPAEQEALDRLFLVDPETGESTWQALKVDPQNPTLSHFEALMARASWLLAFPISTEALACVPDVKIQRFATEALALDANRMKDLQVRKRSTLALSLLRVQHAQILDDVAEMFCKRMLKIQHQGQVAFDLAQKAARERVTRLVETLRDVTRAHEKEGTMAERMEAIDAVYGGNSGQVLTDCEAQLALLTNTSLPFRQLSWIHHEHMSEEKLDAAITRVINGYAHFDLPRRWGSGKRASADGTKWEIYTHNLLAEYHIRYGGYGGIGYYHVSDTYIALFSRFIPCGVHEAIFILDGLLKNDSDIKPVEVTGDTQAQNAVVFGLAHLLGIRLIPRIRNWKDLTLYRPTPQSRYEHINALFSDDIDWDLIERHVPDLLRIVLSIKTGTITASTILGKLNTYSHKNKLYQAFRELGRVIRTGFLLQYIGDPELRAIIQRETNKSESFNGFAKWLAFGNGGVIPTNNRREMRKYLKYNHLLANIVIFANVALLTDALNELASEGYRIDPEAVAALSPYMTQHLVRFGLYHMDRTRRPKPLIYQVSFDPEKVQEEEA